MFCLKILILTDYFLPSLGGVERHTHALACYLSRQSHEVHVITSCSGNRDLDFKLDKDLWKFYGIRVLRLQSNSRYLPLPDEIRYVYDSNNVLNIINKFGDNFDVVHYHGMHQLLLRFAKSRVPIITSVHGIFPSCILQLPKHCMKNSSTRCALCAVSQNIKNVAILPMLVPYYSCYYKLMKASLANVQSVICVSDFVREHVRSKFPELSNLHAIPNFIDFATEISPGLKSASNFDIRNKLSLPAKGKLITYFGRLSSDKGADLLLSSFKILLDNTKEDCYLLIGGSGNQKAHLEQTAKSIKNVIFLGALQRNVQLVTMAQSDIFVHPARYPDACPTSLIEATALGLPIVSSNLGGIPEIVVNGKGGYLFESNSSKDLAAKLVSLIQDESLRAKFKAFNIRWSHEFDISYIGPRVVELYNDAITRAPAKKED